MSPQRTRAGMIRGYTATGGSARPRHDLDRFALLTADVSRPLRDLTPEAYRAATLCAPGQLSVAEVGHYLSLPLSVTRTLVSQLIDSGHLSANEPLPSDAYDTSTLTRIRDALQKL